MTRRQLVLVTRLDESGKQRMRLERLGLELGVELHRDIPRMRGQLDDLDELSVERAADNLESAFGQRLLEETIEFVAMTMTFVDDIAAIQRLCA